jgi:hypothetical protein
MKGRTILAKLLKGMVADAVARNPSPLEFQAEIQGKTEK